MKKLLLFVTMAASLLLTQCKKEESVSSAGKTVSMTVTAGPGSKTDIASTGAITWSAGDKLYVGDGSKYIGYLTIASGVGTPTGVFTGNVTLPTDTKDGEKSFGFFYLGSGELMLEDGATSVDVDFSSQNITKGTDGKLTNASKQHVGYGSAKGTVTDGTVTDINVMLVSKVALARFSFTKDSQPYTGGLTLKGDNIYNEMTVNFDGTFTGKDGSTTDGISLTGSHSERYVMLVPTSTVADHALTFTGDNVSGTGEVPGLQANQFYGKDEAIPVTLESTKVPVEKVELNKDELSLEVGGTETLTATVTPDNATDKSVTWSSDDESVATVSDAGVVTAVAAGEATITVTTVDGGKKATCIVTVTAPKPVFSVGNNTTVEFAPGNLYWDGTASSWKFESNQWDFRTYNDGTKQGGSCINGAYNSNTGTPNGDWGLFGWSGSDQTHYGKITTQNNPDYSGSFMDWGGLAIGNDPVNTWRTLSKGEWNYLLNNRAKASSLRAWVTLDNNVPGLVILPDGSTTAASTVTTTALVGSSGAVFLPASGNRDGMDVNAVGSVVSYWSSTPDGTDVAYLMYFYSGNVLTVNTNRYYGNAVRLVRAAE